MQKKKLRDIGNTSPAPFLYCFKFITYLDLLGELYAAIYKSEEIFHGIVRAVSDSCLLYIYIVMLMIKTECMLSKHL